MVHISDGLIHNIFDITRGSFMKLEVDVSSKLFPNSVCIKV